MTIRIILGSLTCLLVASCSLFNLDSKSGGMVCEGRQQGTETIVIRAVRGELWVRPPVTRPIHAGSRLVFNINERVDTPGNVKLQWDGKEPLPGKSGDWLNHGNGENKNKIEFLIPCDAGNDPPIEYKYSILADDVGQLDPKVVVEPPN